MTLGQRLQRARRLYEFSQEDIGDIVGVTRSAVSAWEADTTAPKSRHLVEMSKLFKVDIDYFPKGTGSEPRAPVFPEALAHYRRSRFRRLYLFVMAGIFDDVIWQQIADGRHDDVLAKRGYVRK